MPKSLIRTPHAADRDVVATASPLSMTGLWRQMETYVQTCPSCGATASPDAQICPRCLLELDGNQVPACAASEVAATTAPAAVAKAPTAISSSPAPVEHGTRPPPGFPQPQQQPAKPPPGFPAGADTTRSAPATSGRAAEAVPGLPPFSHHGSAAPPDGGFFARPVQPGFASPDAGIEPGAAIESKSGGGMLAGVVVVSVIGIIALASWAIYGFLFGSAGADKAVPLGSSGVVFDKPEGWRAGAVNDAAARAQVESLGLEGEMVWEFFTRDGSELAVLAMQVPAEVSSMLALGIPEFDASFDFEALPIISQQPLDHPLGPAREVVVGPSEVHGKAIYILHGDWLVGATIGNLDEPMTSEDSGDYDALIESLRTAGASSGKVDAGTGSRAAVGF